MNSGGISLGNVLGVPVTMAYTGLLFLAYIVFVWGGTTPAGMVQGLMWAVVIFSSILVHELGHAAMVTHYELGEPSITLHAFGGFCSYQRIPRPWPGLVVAAAGPIADFVLAAAAWAVGQVGHGVLPDPVQSVIYMTVSVNLFWGVFNLLPVLPMDGGSVLLNGLMIKLVPPTARKIVKWSGIVTSILIIAAAYALGMTMAMIFGGIFLARNIQTRV